MEKLVAQLYLMEHNYPHGRPATILRADDSDHTFEDPMTADQYVHHDPQYCRSCGCILNDNIPSENHCHSTEFNAIPVNPRTNIWQEDAWRYVIT